MSEKKMSLEISPEAVKTNLERTLASATNDLRTIQSQIQANDDNFHSLHNRYYIGKDGTAEGLLRTASTANNTLFPQEKELQKKVNDINNQLSLISDEIQFRMTKAANTNIIDSSRNNVAT